MWGLHECRNGRHCAPRQGDKPGFALALRGNYATIAARAGTSRQAEWGAPLMFTYVPDVVTYLVFGILMAACVWYVDGSLKDDAD